jgi:Transposase DDE domain
LVSAAERELPGAGVAEAPALVVADAGYWHHDQMDALASRGIRILSPPHAGKRKAARPGRDGGRCAFMRRVLETELGKQLYRKRRQPIEPVFANTKFNRRIDRFLRRGRSACRSQWRPITATHNPLKLHRSQNALATA